MESLRDVIERPAGLAREPRAFAPSEMVAPGISETPGPSDRLPSPPSIGRELCFAPRRLIFLQGDEAHAIYQVVDGAVMLYKLLSDGRRQVVEMLRAGDVFGFSPLPVHDCSAETLRATRCVAFDRDFVERSPALVRWLNARLRSQLCALHEHVMLLGRKSAMERMTTFLMRAIPGRGCLGCPGPGAGEDRADIRLHMMRQEIADYLGLTIETVSRCLAKLKRRGIVSIGKLDEVRVHDVCRLCRLTGTQNDWCDAPMQ